MTSAALRTKDAPRRLLIMILTVELAWTTWTFVFTPFLNHSSTTSLLFSAGVFAVFEGVLVILAVRATLKRSRIAVIAFWVLVCLRLAGCFVPSVISLVRVVISAAAVVTASLLTFMIFRGRVTQ